MPLSTEEEDAGPLTFSVSDAAGNVTFAANQIRTPGEIVTQDRVIQKRELAGTGTVRTIVKRSDRDPADRAALVAGAHAGVYAQGYGLTDGTTDSNGRIESTCVPAGFISILASEFGLTRESAGVDLDLRPDAVIEQTLTLHVPGGRRAGSARHADLPREARRSRRSRQG